MNDPRGPRQDEYVSVSEAARRRQLLTAVVVTAAAWVMIVAVGALIYQGQMNWPRFLMALIPGTLLIVLWVWLNSTRTPRN